MKAIKKRLSYPAGWINKISRGQLKPNHLTIIGLILHLPIAWLIATEYLIVAGFGLLLAAYFDLLDGALARLQNSTSDFGAWLDACSDRLKEIIVFAGLIYYLSHQTDNALYFILCLLTLGFSLLISYVKAKGESILALKHQFSTTALNRLLSGGLMSYEGRVIILSLSLVVQAVVMRWFFQDSDFQVILIGLSLILVGSLLTIFQRFLKLKQWLNRVAE